jgi:hypothetical protein
MTVGKIKDSDVFGQDAGKLKANDEPLRFFAKVGPRAPTL